jgi:hypothetical protein
MSRYLRMEGTSPFVKAEPAGPPAESFVPAQLGRNSPTARSGKGSAWLTQQRLFPSLAFVHLVSSLLLPSWLASSLRSSRRSLLFLGTVNSSQKLFFGCWTLRAFRRNRTLQTGRFRDYPRRPFLSDSAVLCSERSPLGRLRWSSEQSLEAPASRHTRFPACTC